MQARPSSCLNLEHCSFHFTLPPRQQQVEQTQEQDPPAFRSFISNQRRRLPFGNPDYINQLTRRGGPLGE
jgi:hypothetical protein